jgi:hypothetical protein
MWVALSGQLHFFLKKEKRKRKRKKELSGLRFFLFPSFFEATRQRQDVERRERKSLTGLKAPNFLLIVLLFSRLLPRNWWETEDSVSFVVKC